AGEAGAGGGDHVVGAQQPDAGDVVAVEAGGEVAAIRADGERADGVLADRELAALLAADDVPEADGAVLGAVLGTGDQGVAVGGEEHHAHASAVGQFAHLLAAGDVPEAGAAAGEVVRVAAVGGAGGEQSAVGAEGDRPDAHVSMGEALKLATAGGVPDAGGAVAAAGGEEAAVRAEGDRVDV